MLFRHMSGMSLIHENEEIVEHKSSKSSIAKIEQTEIKPLGIGKNPTEMISCFEIQLKQYLFYVLSHVH